MSYKIFGTLNFNYASLYYDMNKYGTKNAVKPESKHDGRPLKVIVIKEEKTIKGKPQKKAEQVIHLPSKTSDIPKEAQNKSETETVNKVVSKIEETAMTANTRENEKGDPELPDKKSEMKIGPQKGQMGKNRQLTLKNLVKLVQKALTQMGGHADLDYQNEDSVSLICHTEGKGGKIYLNQNGNFEADFSNGYSNQDHEDCIHDLKQFLSKLQEMGVDVHVNNSVPVQSHGGNFNEKTKSVRRRVKRPKAIARVR